MSISAAALVIRSKPQTEAADASDVVCARAQASQFELPLVHLPESSTVYPNVIEETIQNWKLLEKVKFPFNVWCPSV